MLSKPFQLQGAVHEPYRASRCLASRFQFPKHPPIVQHLWKLTTICYSHCFVQHTYIINTCPSSILRTDSCISLCHIPQTGPIKPRCSTTRQYDRARVLREIIICANTLHRRELSSNRKHAQGSCAPCHNLPHT